jgi:hypothetical protein
MEITCIYAPFGVSFFQNKMSFKHLNKNEQFRIANKIISEAEIVQEKILARLDKKGKKNITVIPFRKLI